MKIDKWAVSVQWGEGHHYFIRYFADEKDAEQCAEGHMLQLRKQYRKGARPHVSVWRLHSDRVFAGGLSDHNRGGN